MTPTDAVSVEKAKFCEIVSATNKKKAGQNKTNFCTTFFTYKSPR
jgi:hypothetical protein